MNNRSWSSSEIVFWILNELSCNERWQWMKFMSFCFSLASPSILWWQLFRNQVSVWWMTKSGVSALQRWLSSPNVWCRFYFQPRKWPRRDSLRLPKEPPLFLQLCITPVRTKPRFDCFCYDRRRRCHRPRKTSATNSLQRNLEKNTSRGKRRNIFILFNLLQKTASSYFCGPRKKS